MSNFYNKFKKKKDSKSKVELWKNRMNQTSHKYDSINIKQDLTVKKQEKVIANLNNKSNYSKLLKMFTYGTYLLVTILYSLFLQASPLSGNFKILPFTIVLVFLLPFLIILLKKKLISTIITTSILLTVTLISLIGFASQIKIDNKVYFKYSETSYVFSESKDLLKIMYEVENNNAFLNENFSLIVANQENLTNIISKNKTIIAYLGDKKFKISELTGIRNELLDALVNQITACKYIENEIVSHDEKNISNISNYIDISNKSNRSAANLLGDLSKQYNISLEELKNE